LNFNRQKIVLLGDWKHPQKQKSVVNMRI